MRSLCFIGPWLALTACGTSPDQPADSTGDEDESSAGGDAQSGSNGPSAGSAGSATTGDAANTSKGGGSNVGGGGGDRTGGAGGAPEGGPHTSSPCSALPAAGTWENITPTGVTYTDAVVVDPFDAATVWLGAKDRGIFKSKDCGATWAHVSTGRSGAGVDTGEPISIQVDPVHQGVMYTTSFYGASGMFKSTNGGVDWDQVFPPGSEVARVVEYNLINSIGMDARDPNHMVVSMHAVCAAPYGAVCEAETSDAGATWKITTVPVPGNGWVAGAGAFILDASTWLFGTYSVGLWLTTDHGATWSNVTPKGASGSTSGKTIILPFSPSSKGNYYLAAMEGILRSTDGKTWSLIPSSGGRSVGFAMGDGHLFSADQWAATYHTAVEGDSAAWSVIAAPPTLPKDQGAPYLAYDSSHHLLYSSNWAGGLWRLGAP